MMTYTTPSTTILTIPQYSTGGRIPTGESLAGILSYLATPCTFAGLFLSAQIIKYKFNLGDISKIGKIKKCLSSFGSFIHVDKNKIVFEDWDDTANFSISLPRERPEVVHLVNCLNTKSFDSSHPLSAILGISSENQILKIDLLQSPHILVAGTTGSGKSVAIDTILTSLLFKATPHDIKFIIIDPKRVSFSAYEDIPHLLMPIVKDDYRALEALKYACSIMDKRSIELDKQGLKDITKTNLPHVLIVIDELADLMQSPYRKEIDSLIQRIAQVGRFAGIHLLVATQQPTVKILTTTIKANITTRIALKTSNMRDSMNILDYKGAEELRGKGDGLARLPEYCQDIRFQTAYIEDSEIKKICDYWRKEKEVL